jgi:hypothetical protein
MPTATPAPIWALPYGEDFEARGSEAGEEWSWRGVLLAPNGATRFLGSLSSATVELALAPLPPHKELALSLDLYLAGSWDGNAEGENGPDTLEISVEGLERPLLAASSFCNGGEWPSNSQSYPQPYDGAAANPPGEGAFATNTLGFTGEAGACDATYRLAWRFSHSAPSLRVLFRALTRDRFWQTGNESWALDNVRVEVPGQGAEGSELYE